MINISRAKSPSALPLVSSRAILLDDYMYRGYLELQSVVQGLVRPFRLLKFRQPGFLVPVEKANLEEGTYQ